MIYECPACGDEAQNEYLQYDEYDIVPRPVHRSYLRLVKRSRSAKAQYSNCRPLEDLGSEFKAVP